VTHPDDTFARTLAGFAFAGGVCVVDNVHHAAALREFGCTYERI
jgi:hypothetical protein